MSIWNFAKGAFVVIQLLQNAHLRQRLSYLEAIRALGYIKIAGMF